MAKSLMIIAAFVLAGMAALVWIYAPPPVSGLRFTLPSTPESVRPRMALTFDDGPNPDHTPALLNVLDRHSVKATFFVTGKYAEAYPELVREIHLRGHTVGNHFYSEKAPAFMGFEAARSSLEKTDRALAAAGVARPVLVRAPRLQIGVPLVRHLEKEGRILVGGTGFGWDWGTQDPDKICKMARKFAGPGRILAFHDGDDHQDRGDRGGTVIAVDRLLGELGSQYDFVPLADIWLAKD